MLCQGSSPRVWGQDKFTMIYKDNNRIIPTRVGTSQTDFSASAYLEDHPHACGDKGNFSKILSHEAGSSPRVWGQVCTLRAVTVGAGIIPTRVGTRKGRKQLFFSVRDHPHACGDKIPVLVTVAFSLGSSPRVWGQEVGSKCYTNCVRIIPTRVGTRGDFC